MNWQMLVMMVALIVGVQGCSGGANHDNPLHNWYSVIGGGCLGLFVSLLWKWFA